MKKIKEWLRISDGNGSIVWDRKCFWWHPELLQILEKIEKTTVEIFFLYSDQVK